MRNIFCFKLIQFLITIFNIFFVLNASAQYSSNTSKLNKVKTIRQEIDSPVEIQYEDGRVAQMMQKESVDVFRVPIRLTENSCQKPVGLKCTLVVPFVRQQFAAVWKVHPTRQAQPLEYSFKKDVTYGNQVAITRSQNELYETILRRIPSGNSDRATLIKAFENKSLGQIECDQDTKSILPNNREILFWEENYEAGNSELAMIEGPNHGARVNLLYRRFQNIAIEPQGNIIRFSRFKKSYGQMGDYYPIGLSYMLQLTFRSPNENDPSDEVCKLKWDVNFSEYFIQASSLLINGGRGAFDPSGFTIYRYKLENSNPYAQGIFKKELWEQEGMQ